MSGAQDYTRELHQVNGHDVNVTTYRIGDIYHCHIDNRDPGATIARSRGKNLNEVKRIALEKAMSRL